MRTSLKARLIALVLAGVALVWVGTVVLTWLDARAGIENVMDAHLAQSAALLIAQTSGEIEEIDTEHAPLLHRLSRSVAFQIWEHGTRLRLHSVNAPQIPLGTRDEGFSDRAVDGHRWRVFSAWDESGDFLIHVGEDRGLRDKFSREIAEGLLRPLLIALPLLAVLVWFGVQRGLRPLSGLGDEISKRDPDNLRPIDLALAPREVVPLIEQLNRLFTRIGVSIERERRFTSDAAHELRTPIAAIKAQAQVARLTPEAKTRDHAIEQVIAGSDRAGRLIDQLLTLARLDTASEDKGSRCALGPLAAQVVADMTVAALQRGVQLELQEQTAVPVRAVPGLVEILLRNLIDNAVRHSPAGEIVHVIVSQRQGTPLLSVVDGGTGIPEAEREKVLQRFYRIADGDADGSGLGLSIVQRIADIHGARLSLAEPETGTGLRVDVQFPAPA